MPLHQLLYLAVFWLFGSPANVVMQQLHCSVKTVSDYYKLFRQMVVKIEMLDNYLTTLDDSNDNNNNSSSSSSSGAEKEKKMEEEKKALSACHAWRERNTRDLWGAFLMALRRLKYCPGVGGGFEEKEGWNAFVNDGGGGSSSSSPGEERQKGGESSQHFVDRPLPAINHVHTALTAAATAGMDLHQPRQEKPKKEQQKKAQQPLQSTGHRSIPPLLFGETKSTKNRIRHPSPEQEYSARKRSRTLPSIPSFMDICCMIPSEEKAIAFLTAEGVFPHDIKEITCSHCGYKGFRYKDKKSLKGLKCNRCNKSSSLMKGTFFDGTKTPLHQVLYIALFWLSLSPASTAITQLGCSSVTITQFSEKFRLLARRYLDWHRAHQHHWQGGSGTTTLIPPPVESNATQLEPHIPKFARKEKRDDHLYAAAWREMNIHNLWQAFIVALRTVKNYGDGSNAMEDGNRVWVDEANGRACCKYHLKVHLQKRRQSLRELGGGPLWAY